MAHCRFDRIRAATRTRAAVRLCVKTGTTAPEVTLTALEVLLTGSLALLTAPRRC